MVLWRGRSKTRQGMRTLTLIVLPIVMAAGGENFPGGRCYVILASWGRKRKKLRAGNIIDIFESNIFSESNVMLQSLRSLNVYCIQSSRIRMLDCQ